MVADLVGSLLLTMLVIKLAESPPSGGRVTTADLESLVRSLRQFRSDLGHVEAKRAESVLPRRLWETISAFSNASGGGVLILGLDETAGFAATGIRNTKKMMQDLASTCDDMEPAVRALIEPHMVEGVTLLVAEIPEANLNQKPVFYRGAGPTNGAFLRVADGDRKLTQYEVQVIMASRGQPRDDHSPVVEATIEDMDGELVDGILNRLRRMERSSFDGKSREQSLLALRAIVPYGDGFVPSLGGLLALGSRPQEFFLLLDVLDG